MKWSRAGSWPIKCLSFLFMVLIQTFIIIRGNLGEHFLQQDFMKGMFMCSGETLQKGQIRE
jgi:hypothetical protein